ncbi:MAG: hypothetical protein ACKOJI_03505, partial [Phycisphaerales bacterium]
MTVRSRRRRPVRRGAALLMALFAMMVVGTSTLAYVASRDTSAAIASNAVLGADARTLAAAGMDLAKQLLRTSETQWRRNHQDGWLVRDYALDGGTVGVRLVDLEKRAAGATGAAANPDDSTSELEVTVTSERGGATWAA